MSNETWSPFVPKEPRNSRGFSTFEVQARTSPSPGGGDETTYRHPSFGQISISRWQGQSKNRLFQTNIDTQTGISIEIKRAELKRDLSHDWVFGYETLAKVNLSPSQFADLLVNMNTTGVPCTISSYIEPKTGEWMHPLFPEHFDNEASRIEQEFNRAIKDLELMDPADLEVVKDVAKRLPKKEQERLLGALERIGNKVKSHIPFIRDTFEESVQRTVNQAKAEVASFVTHAVHQAGLEHLQDQAPSLRNGSLPSIGTKAD